MLSRKSTCLALLGVFVLALVGCELLDYVEDDDDRGDRVQVHLLGVTPVPARVRPGRRLTFRIRYAIRMPSAHRRVLVEHKARVSFRGRPVLSTEASVRRRRGTYTHALPITVPPRSRRGTYTAKITVRAAGETRQHTVQFTVY